MMTPEQRKEYDIKYRLSHKLKTYLTSKLWRVKNRDYLLRKKKEYRQENREKIAIYDKIYRQTHKKERCLLTGIDNKKRRRAEGSHTEQEWEDLKKKYNYTCLCCKRTEPEIKLTKDHIKTISLGGKNYLWNIQPLCNSCNSSKKKETIDYRPHALSDIS